MRQEITGRHTNKGRQKHFEMRHNFIITGKYVVQSIVRSSASGYLKKKLFLFAICFNLLLLLSTNKIGGLTVNNHGWRRESTINQLLLSRCIFRTKYPTYY